MLPICKTWRSGMMSDNVDLWNSVRIFFANSTMSSYVSNVILVSNSDTLSFLGQCWKWNKGVVERESRTKGQGGVSGRRPKKKSDRTNFDGRSGHKELWICSGWFSWSSRCIWVAVLTVLIIGESGRAIWTNWHPLNLSSEDGKETVKKLYNIKHWC